MSRVVFAEVKHPEKLSVCRQVVERLSPAMTTAEKHSHDHAKKKHRPLVEDEVIALRNNRAITW